jgi:hypothetical protein
VLALAPGWAGAQTVTELTTKDGKAVVNGSLARGDGKDPLDLTGESPCKVYTLRMAAGRTYKITMTSKELDSFLRLENPNRLNETGDDNGAGGKDARIVFDCRRGGTYRIICTRRRGPAEGEFTLTVEGEGAGKDDVAGKALEIRDGRASVNGRLTDADPRDTQLQGSYCKVYGLKLAEGATYKIDMFSTDFDTYLRLEDPDGVQVARDDDGGGNLNARITYRCSKAGTYKVIATSFRPGATGAFTLGVEETGVGVAKENPAVGKGVLKLKGGTARVIGTLTAATPKDTVRTGSHARTYQVQLEGGKTYRIDLVGTAGLDTYLRLEDATGKQLDSNDDGGENLNARLTFRCQEAGTYRVIATTYRGGATGRYTLTIQEQ